MAVGHNSFEDVPWINTLVDFTARILKQNRIRIIGVCFGHQIVGRAMGVKVGRNDDGWEAAVHDVDLSEKGKQLFGKDKLVNLPI
jgi:GMP synthase-like glutamine amidotransferase